MKKNVTLFFLLCSMYSFAQSIHAPKGNQAYHIIDRLEIKSGKFAPFHSSHKYYQRKDVVQYALELDSMSWLTPTDKTDLQYLYRDNSLYLGETPLASKSHPKFEENSRTFLKHFYKSKGKFYEYTNEDFSVVAQPVSATDYFGIENTEFSNSSYFMMNNGAQLQGSINNKVHFFSRVVSDFDRYQPHVRRNMVENKAIMGRGFYTAPNEFGGIDSLFDNINAVGYIDFKATKNINFQFGHGRNFIGNGMRSLILSDVGHNYLYLKINTKFGLFDYENIFAEMRQLSTLQTATGVLAKKYLTAHHLSFNVTDNFNVGIFEGIVSARENSGIELQYLNPIIFYRSVERDLDSPDNFFIGADAKLNFAKRFQLYGQIGLDELQLDNLRAIPDSWAHKFALQAGLKYIDVFGIDHLDAQVEFNRVRPYTYTHFQEETTYSHFSQPLAHPLGANFTEFLAVLRYQPSDKLFFTMKLMQANIGKDTLDANWGSNIFTNYRTREVDNVTVGQGVNTNILMFDFQAEYMIFHNMYATFHLQYRNEDSILNGLDYNHLFISIGSRLNFWNEPHLF